MWENVCTYVCVCLTASLCVIWEALGGSDSQRDSRTSPPSSMEMHKWDRMAGSTETPRLEGKAGFRENFRSALLPLHSNSWTPCRYTTSMSHSHMVLSVSRWTHLQSKQYDGTTTKLHHSRYKQNTSLLLSFSVFYLIKLSLVKKKC